MPGNKIHAVFLGRISPLHKGHQKVIDRMISDFGIKNCLLIIGSSDSYNERTPYTFKEREKMVKILYPSLKVIGFPDVNLLNVWLENLKSLEKSMSAKFVFYGGSEKDISYLKKTFKTTVAIDRNKRGQKISATKIREALKNRNLKELGEMLDSEIIPLAVSGFKKFEKAKATEI